MKRDSPRGKVSGDWGEIAFTHYGAARGSNHATGRHAKQLQCVVLTEGQWRVCSKSAKATK